ncbi:hypothetical protein PFISCL1PPCAC_12354, partial [Pristionchus fissidentatus]
LFGFHAYATCCGMKKLQLDESAVDNEALPQDVFGSAPWIAAATRFIDRLLMLPTSSFWSTLTHREEVVHWLDDVVDWIPRPYETDRVRALDADGDVLAALRLLKGSVLALFLRTAVYDKERDPSMSAVNWLAATRLILPLSRVARWIAPFAPPHDAKNKRNRSLFAKSLELWSNVEGCRASEDLIKLEGRHIEELSDIKKDVNRIVGAWNSSRGVKRASVAEIIMQFLEGAVDWLYCAMAFYRVAEAAKLRCRPAKLIPEVASMVECFSAFLSTDNVQEMAMHLCDYPIRRVFRLRSQLEQFGAELVYDLLLEEKGVDKRAAIVVEIMVNERFVYALDDRHSLEAIMAKGTMTQKANVTKTLAAVRTKQEKTMLADMSRLGLGKNLGSMSSMPQRVAVAVDEVLAILPQLSTPFIHACLRHVAYDASAAIDMIVSNQVPGWLRRLEASSERTKGGEKKWYERMEEQNTSVRPPILFDHEDCNLLDVVKSSNSRETATSAVKDEEKRSEEEGRNMFKGIFSLAPVQKKREESKEVDDVATVAASESRAASALALSAIRASLERLSMRAHGEDEAFGMERERLVEMKGSKAHATADKYKNTASDRASLRPFYERFKYETDERDEDIYNDEYDDGYEEKAFKTDPLTNDVASSDEEKNKQEEERERMENRRGGGGRGGRGGETRGGEGGMRGGGRGGAAPAAVAAPSTGSQQSGGGGGSSAYTGGRQRQLQEKNKNKFRQRGADRKTRGML